MAKKMKTFSNAEITRLRESFEEHMKPWLEKYGLRMDVGEVGFNPHSMRIERTRFTIPSALKDHQVKKLQMTLQTHKIIPLGRDSTLRSDTLRLVGYKYKNTVNPWVVEPIHGGPERTIDDTEARLHFAELVPLSADTGVSVQTPKMLEVHNAT